MAVEIFDLEIKATIALGMAKWMPLMEELYEAGMLQLHQRSLGHRRGIYWLYESGGMI